MISYMSAWYYAAGSLFMTTLICYGVYRLIKWIHDRRKKHES